MHGPPCPLPLMSTPERLAFITHRTWTKAVNGQDAWYNAVPTRRRNRLLPHRMTALGQTVDTPHAPGNVKYADLTLRRFGDITPLLLPTKRASDIPGLFTATFEHGTGAGSLGPDAWLACPVQFSHARTNAMSPGVPRG